MSTIKGDTGKAALDKSVKNLWPEVYQAMPQSFKNAVWQYSQREFPRGLTVGHDAGFDAGYSFRKHEEQIEKFGHPQGSNCPNPNKDGFCGCPKSIRQL